MTKGSHTTEHSEFDASRALLRQAELALSGGDNTEASIKGWKAAELAMKTVAAQWDLPRDTHPELVETAMIIAIESGNDDIDLLFDVADSLNTNIYEGWFDKDGVAFSLGDIERLLDMLEALPERHVARPVK